jgi:cell division ATPase FtsA
MFSLFSNKKTGVLSIILDIQSGLVRGALVSNKHNESTHILSVVTKTYSGKSNILNSEHLIKKNLKLVSEVIEHLARDAKGYRVSSITYTLSTPWIFSKLKTVKINYNNETLITERIIRDIIKNEIKNDEKLDTKPIEQNIFEIRLNGYPTVDFDGKRAHTLEISLSTSFSPKTFLDKVETVVNKHIFIKHHEFHSALLMQYVALREVLKDRNEYIYIHTHNELTDMIIIKDGLCKYIASFPFGVQTMLRKVAIETKTSIEASDSLLALYQGNKLTDEEKIKTKQILNPLLQEWVSGCTKIFSEMFDFTSIPRSIYLSSHSHFELFKEAMATQDVFRFEVISHDTIDTNNSIIFEKNVPPSNMMTLYAFAIQNML